MNDAEECVVLISGMLCTSRLWQGVVDSAPGRSVRCVVPSACSIGEEVDELLDSLTGPVALVGFSLGANVAMAFADRAPERVARLVLISGNPRAPRPEQFAAWRTMQRRTREGKLASVARNLLPSLLAADRRNDPALSALVEKMAHEVGSEQFLNQLSMQSSRVDQRGNLKRLSCPTLVIAAEADSMCPIDATAEIADAVPGAHWTTIPGAGHLSLLERPDLLRVAIAEWIEPPHKR